MLTASNWKEQPTQEMLTRALGDPSGNVRIAAVRIIADKNIVFFKDKLNDMLPSTARDSQLYQTLAAALKELGD